MEHPDSVGSSSSSRSSSPGRASSGGGNQSACEDDSGTATKPAKKWTRKEQIGQGAQGCVYRCLESKTGREAACKVILLRDLSAAEVTSIKREVATIKRLKHPRLVQYWRATEVPRKRLSIYMEFVAGGALSGRLRRGGPLPVELVQKLTRQLCEALAFLHAHGIAHRDIKCANVFLTTNGDDADIKLGDFGAFKETGCASLVGGLKGTPHWMAPEVIRGGPQSAPDATGSSDGETWWFRADVWSLGCAVLEMLTGHAPWRQYSNPHTAMYQIVATDNTPTIPADASDETVSFLQRCLQRDPVNRASIADLLLHSFLGGSGATASSTSTVNEMSRSSAATAHVGNDADGRGCSAGSDNAETEKKNAGCDDEPESSPTVRSKDEMPLLPRCGVLKPADCRHRRLGPKNLDGDNDVEEEEAVHQEQPQPESDQQHLEKPNGSPEHPRPSRIPRLKPLYPLKKKVTTTQACGTKLPMNNNDPAGDNAMHSKQSGSPETQPSGPQQSSSLLPRLIVVEQSHKKREFAISKLSLMQTNSTAFTGAAAPLKPAVVARRTVRAVSPLQQRRVATAPACDASSSGTSGTEMAMSPPGDGHSMARLKLPPLTAARAVTASSCR